MNKHKESIGEWIGVIALGAFLGAMMAIGLLDVQPLQLLGLA